MASAHLSIIPEFLEKIEMLNVSQYFDVNKSEITNTLTGSDIIFRGIKTSSGNQTANLKSLQGVTTWILDEAEELTDEETFDKIDLSIRQKGVHNKVILILNPTTKEHWIYKRFFESKGVPDGFNGVKDNVCYIHTTYLDNIANLDDSFIHSIEIMKERRPEKYKHQILGGWLSRADGVVFDNWRIGKFRNDWGSVFGQDYGFSIDPTTLVETSINKAQKEIYVKLHLYQPKLTTSEIAMYNQRYAGTNLIVGDSAEPRLISEVKDKGCNLVAVKKGKDSIKTGIAMLKDYDLIIDEDSVDLIKELNNYVWHDKKSETPIDNFNHAIDALKYAVYYQLNNAHAGDYYVY
jgi:phage terminase large subunit